MDDGLAFAVLANLEVFLGQSTDDLALRVRDHRVELHELGCHLGHDVLRRGRRRWHHEQHEERNLWEPTRMSTPRALSSHRADLATVAQQPTVMSFQGRH